MNTLTRSSTDYSGLTNSSVYTHLQNQKKENYEGDGVTCRGSWCAAGFISCASLVVMIMGGIIYEGSRNNKNYQDDKMPLRDLQILEGTCAGIIITAVALATFAICYRCFGTNKKNDEVDMTLVNFPQQEKSLGIIGMEHLLKGAQRKDLLIEVFPKLKDEMLKELNVEQLCILYENCPKSVQARRIHFNTHCHTIFMKLERYQREGPKQLAVLLSDINEQKLLADDIFLPLFIKYMPEQAYADHDVQIALIALLKNKQINKSLTEDELLKLIGRMRGENSQNKKMNSDTLIELECLTKDTVIDLEESI